MDESSFPVPVVRLIVTNSTGRILILRRDNTNHSKGEWCLPGGKIDYGQTVEQAAMKELFEETSLEVDAIHFLFYQDSLPLGPGEMHCINLYFKCEVHGDLSLNAESSEHAWIDNNDLDKYCLAFMNDNGVQKYWNDFILNKCKTL